MAGLSGPRLEPKSGKAKRLVVFLHGYGADGNDLIDIGRAWQPLLPDTAFVSPHAPEPCGQAPVGRQWFGLDLPRSGRALDRRQQAAPGAQRVPRRRAGAPATAAGGAGAGRLQPGHHDGAACRPAPAASRRRPSSAIPACSCCPNDGPPEPVARRSSSRPPVLLIHGDRTISFRCRRCSMRSPSLRRWMCRSNGTSRTGVGHGIDQEGLRHGGEFLARRFGLRRHEGGTKGGICASCGKRQAPPSQSCHASLYIRCTAMRAKCL